MIRNLMPLVLMLGALFAACNPPQSEAPAEQPQEQAEPASEQQPLAELQIDVAPVGSVCEVYEGTAFAIEQQQGELDLELAYRMLYEQYHGAVGVMLDSVTEQRQGMEPGALLPVNPLQPLVDRFAASMITHGRPPAWKWWIGFKLEPQNWLTINQETVTMREIDSLPEAQFINFALDEFRYPLNKEMMLKDTGRIYVGIFKVLGDEKWDTLRPELKARLALCGMVYVHRGEWKDDPSPREFTDWREMLLGVDLSGIKGRGAADAAMAYYDAWRLFGPDDALKGKLDEALALAAKETDLLSRAVTAFISRWIAFSAGDTDAAAARIQELEAVLREASADVMISGEAYVLAMQGLTQPLYLESRTGDILPPEILGAVDWMVDTRWLRRDNPELAEGEYGVSIGGESASNSDVLQLKIELMKLQYEHDPLLTMNREMGIEAWRNVEELVALRERANTDKNRPDDEDLPDLDEEA